VQEQTRIDELVQEVQEKMQRIEAVEAEVEEKDRRVAELEERVKEMKQNVQSLQQEKEGFNKKFSKEIAIAIASLNKSGVYGRTNGF